jgi:hypothetical protein
MDTGMQLTSPFGLRCFLPHSLNITLKGHRARLSIPKALRSGLSVSHLQSLLPCRSRTFLITGGE